ncbi:MAG: hypothetical protein KC422_20765 [Trueperaceae bacterium]|nr:hypothetical protein [Trueperaceae bacterium]
MRFYRKGATAEAWTETDYKSPKEYEEHYKEWGMVTFDVTKDPDSTKNTDGQVEFDSDDIKALVSLEFDRLNEQQMALFRENALLKGKIEELSEEKRDLEEQIYLLKTKLNAKDLLLIRLYSDEEIVISPFGNYYINHLRFEQTSPVEYYETLMVLTSSESLLYFFTNYGYVYRKKVSEVRNATRIFAGELLNLREGERVVSLLSSDGYEWGQTIILGTKRGYLREFFALDIDNVSSYGKLVIDLHDDELMFAQAKNGSADILMVSKNGKIARISDSKLLKDKRTLKSVRGLTLTDEDFVIGINCIAYHQQKNAEFLIITRLGKGKRIRLSDLEIERLWKNSRVEHLSDFAEEDEIKCLTQVSEELVFVVLSKTGKWLLRTPKKVKASNLEDPLEEVVKLSEQQGVIGTMAKLGKVEIEILTGSCS